MGLTHLHSLRARRYDDGDDGDAPVLSPMDRPLERRIVTPTKVAVSAAVLGLIALTTYGYVELSAGRTLSADPARLTLSTVAHGTFREYIPLTGQIVPRTTVYLDAIEGGQVVEVYVEAGALVSAGQPLLRLKNTNLQLEVIGREAQLTEQLNSLSSTSLSFEQNRLRHVRELIELDYEIGRLEREAARRRPLLASGGATQGELDELDAELRHRGTLRGAVLEAQRVDEALQATQIERLREAIDAMNMNLGIARENLENLVITAPIDGQLTMLDASVGESKANGQRIGRVDEIGAFKVAALIDEFYLPRIFLGQIATLEASGTEHTLELTKIYPDVRSRQFEVDLSFTHPPDAVMRPGQTVRMRLDIGDPAESLVVANGPFYDDTGGRWVFVVDEAGRLAERRSVRFGRRNPEGIEVLDGLREGERVITSTYDNLLGFDRIAFRSSVD